MAAGDEQPGLLADDLFDLQFMLRVNGAGVAGNGKGFDLVLCNHPLYNFFDLIFIYRQDFFTRDFQLSRNDSLWLVGDILRFEAAIGRHDNHTHFLAFAFNNGVGCQGGGQGHHLHLPQFFLIQLCQGVVNADGEIPLGGEGFALADGPIPFKVIDHRVGIGPAGVDSQSDFQIGAVFFIRTAFFHYGNFGFRRSA